MTKIMAVTIVPLLAVLAFVSTNEGPSQDAKSVAIDATLNAKEYQSHMDVQREQEMLDQRSREYERELIKERRAKAKARAEAQAERVAERQHERRAAIKASRTAEAEAATQAATRESSGGSTSQSGSGNLPELLLFIRSHESGGNYSAYNGSGCEGYGCGGAYQMHARYASGWAASAGYPGMSSNAADWPASTQDAVALWLFYSTNPDGAHWCNWTTYC